MGSAARYRSRLVARPMVDRPTWSRAGCLQPSLYLGAMLRMGATLRRGLERLTADCFGIKMLARERPTQDQGRRMLAGLCYRRWRQRRGERAPRHPPMTGTGRTRSSHARPGQPVTPV